MGRNHEKLLNSLEGLRKSAGLTQQELSELAEVSRKSINAIENGIYVPSTVLALKIARTLKCSVEDLFELTKLPELSGEEELPPPQELRRKRVISAVKNLLIDVRDILFTKWRTHRDSNPEPPA